MDLIQQTFNYNSSETFKLTPTYLFLESLDGLEVIGSGISGQLYPTVIFAREQLYRFIFYNKFSVIKIYDMDDNIIKSFEQEDGGKEEFITFTNSFPEKVKYKISSETDPDKYGIFLIRQQNKISGKVISYGYTQSANIKNELNDSVVSDEAGKFTFIYNESFLDANYILTSSEGYDASLVNKNRNKLKLKFSTPRGSLILNSFTTLFELILQKFVKPNLNDINKKICTFFNITEDYRILTDDPISMYIDDKLSLLPYQNLIVFTMLLEFVSEHGTEKNLQEFYENILSMILDGDKFDTQDLDKLKINKIPNFELFFLVYLPLSAKLISYDITNLKKICIIENILNLVRRFRDCVILKTMSYELYLSDNLVYDTDINLPKIENKILLSTINGCGVPEQGRYAKIDAGANLIQKVFLQYGDMNSEIRSKLIGNVMQFRIKDELYCFKVQNFLEFEYDLPELYATDIIESHKSEFSCCDFIKKVKKTEQEKKLDIDKSVQEENLFELKILNTDKDIIYSRQFTNKSHPNYYYEDYEGMYKPTSLDTHYINDFFVSSKDKTPAFLLLSFSNKNDTQELDLIFNDVKNVYEVNNLRYDYQKIKIISSKLNGDVLSIKTLHSHGYTTGDLVYIYDSSKNEKLDGLYEVIGNTETELYLNFDKSEVESHEIDDSYGYIDTLNSTKIYCKIKNFTKGDEIIFEGFMNSKKFEVIDISSDYIGEYLVVSGLVPRTCKFFSKINAESVGATMKYKLEENQSFYSIDYNKDKYSLWTHTNPGELFKLPSIFILSSISFVFKSIKLDVDYSYSKSNNIISEVKPLNLNHEIKNNDTETVNYTESYHYTRNYLRNEYDLVKIEDGVETEISYSENYDWDGDGLVNENELKILERFILTNPKTVDEYNLNREKYPFATELPNIVTAQYACQENCCHDDFNESADFDIDDVYIYDAFQAYIESLPDDVLTESSNFLDYYDSLAKQGLVTSNTPFVSYMPTDPREFKLCGDYTNTMNISSDDANIFYGMYMYRTQNNGNRPNNLTEFISFYDNLVSNAIVPSLVNPIKKLPSLENEDDIISETGNINKDCESITTKDVVIYNEWIRQNKPTDLDLFNENRLENVPRACFLPQDGDSAPGEEYDEIGTRLESSSEYYSGIENL